jgi:uncharacterized membrane protein YeaQ/YmgE (transglycosylase-associated protein family)
MLHLLAQHSILADGISIHIGENVWSFSLNFIIYLIIAAIVGFAAEFIVGWRLPFGFIGAIIAALLGIWLMTQVIILTGIGDVNVYGVPIVRALIGAILFVALWHLFTARAWYHRRRYSYRRY